MQRRSGILLHPTSLPSRYGIGDLGTEAYQWIDLLARYRQTIWQLCPLSPVGYSYSPYNCHSSFAGNHLLISPQKLCEDGLLTQTDLDTCPNMPSEYVDFKNVITEKEKLFRIAFSRFKLSEEYKQFCEKEKYWLDEFVLFMTIKKLFNGQPWDVWETPFKMRYSDEILNIRTRNQEEMIYNKFLQFLFFRQWNQVHEYARQKGVTIFGDLPYYVAFDSCDVWSSDGIFELDENRKPLHIGGVPPGFSGESGQLWGNPVYDWDLLKKNGYSWWIQRFQKILECVDWVRIDHFRGFEAFWSVPRDNANAINGEWIKGPQKDFFKVLQNVLGTIPLVAEDLGMITREVNALRKSVGIPGMRVLQFAFDGDEDNPHRPHNITKDSVIYTGTHDNDTTAGWLGKISKKDTRVIIKYLGCPENAIFDCLLQTAFKSEAQWCIITLQDVLCLGSKHRINTPGTAEGNWQWRFTHDMLNQEKLEKIATYTLENNRYKE